MSSKNSAPHFTRGIGQYTPWRFVHPRVREALTKYTRGGRFSWPIVAKLKAKTNPPAMIRKLRSTTLVKV